MTFAGATAATESHFGSRHCRSNAQVNPKAKGATASRKGCRRTAEPRRIVSRRDVVRCLSCIQGNLSVQFLGGGRPAMASRYPTVWEVEGPLSAISVVKGAKGLSLMGFRRWVCSAPSRCSGLVLCCCS